MKSDLPKIERIDIEKALNEELTSARDQRSFGSKLYENIERRNSSKSWKGEGELSTILRIDRTHHHSHTYPVYVDITRKIYI